MMQQTSQISTPAHNGLYDITRQVEAIVSESGVQTGMVNVYAGSLFYLVTQLTL